MRPNYIWGKLDYTILKDDKIVRENKNVSCFSSLYNEYKKGTHMIIYNFECEKTKEYTLFYLQYISDMLKLDAEFDNTYFKFKLFPCLYKNMLVGSLIRFLYEKSKSRNNYPIHDELHKRLKYGKCKYRNKLARFCYFYSQMDDKGYKNEAHSWEVNKTKIKYTEDFIKAKSIPCVSSFFTS